MKTKRIVVVGGGFAGLWSAVGAARKLDELGLGPDDVAITLVNRDAYHCIRVRNYEADLSQVRIPLDEVLEPAGIQRIEGTVADIDLAQQQVKVRMSSTGELWSLVYDRLVFALGSQLVHPRFLGSPSTPSTWTPSMVLRASMPTCALCRCKPNPPDSTPSSSWERA